MEYQRLENKNEVLLEMEEQMHKGYNLLREADQRQGSEEIPERELLSGKKNIIFLDIDGVIQPYGNRYRFVHDVDRTLEMLREISDARLVNEGDPRDIMAAYYDWDEVALGRIVKLCRHTGSYIVLHSGWISFTSLEKFKLFFGLHGMADYVLDVCSVFDRSFYEKERQRYAYHVDEKVIQIREWLEDHCREVNKYIVIDDLDMSWSFGNRIIVTSDRFKEADYQQGKMLLSGDTIQKLDENTIRYGSACAKFSIESLGEMRRALFFTLGYSSRDDAENTWSERMGEYKILFSHLIQFFFCEQRREEYDDVSLLCWCWPEDMNPYMRQEYKSIEETISGYRWSHYFSRTNQMLAILAAGNENFKVETGDIETVNKIRMKLLRQWKLF